MPLFLSAEADEIDAVVNRILDSLSTTISSKTGEDGIRLRHTIGVLRANFMVYIRNGLFSSKMLDCFIAARESNVNLLSLVAVREQLFRENPVGEISKVIVNQSIIFCLSTESQMIASINYTNRDDVDLVLGKMRVAFDTARNIIATVDDPAPYQALLSLAGSLAHHLAMTALPLPRMITFTMPGPLPALAASYFVYYDATRWEELVDGNRIIHPAFCRRELRGLSL